MGDRVRVTGVYLDCINFSMQQNYVPAIRNLVLTNTSDTELTGLTVRISFEPEFAKTWEKTVERLAVGQSLELSPVSIVFSPEYLMSLTEKVLGNVCIEVIGAEEVLFLERRPIEQLAYDQWSGYTMMPEMLSAFITPNHPKLTEIVSKAGEYLMQWTNNPSFNAYQTDNPTNVKHQMAAIYAALQTEQIAYIVSAASFEYCGQRVRLADAVLQQKLGSCLDLSLLFAGCLELIGLNPLVVLVEGHAFVGCWLENETFSEVVQDDVSGLKKRTAEGIEQICLLETTALTAGKSISFDEAVKMGRKHLDEEEKFLMLIDVARSRSGGIRPIPMRIMENGVFRAEEYQKRPETMVTGAPTEVQHSFLALDENQTELTKQKLWERKLLDLSLRNMLLSFRVTKNCLQLMAGDLGSLEDALVRGEDMKILPRPEDFVNTLRDSKIYALENAGDSMSEFILSEFGNNRIRTFVDAEELEDKMKNISRQAKVSLEENGTNTLYLALGFLKWYETDISEKCRYAPLVLIPVDVIRRLQEKSFVLRIRDEEAQMNITLLELLRQDFGINISGLDPLPSDESGTDLKLVFNTIRQAVMGRKRWDVEEFAFLGLFSFSQFIMWNDIRNRSAELQKNKVVASLISGKLEWQPETDILAPEELDSKLSVMENAVPTSADSTQMVAICSAAKGQSFVLHGPPGTGKSQTITNMIANALYQGKSVLFVAEKMAALNVVQKRLAKIGLDPFCLELHSNRAKKRDVLEQLDRTLKVGRVKEPAKYAETAKQIAEVRAELNGVVEELHKTRNYGFSLYEAIAMYEQNSILEKKDRSVDQRRRLTVSRELVRSMDASRYQLWMDILRRLQAAVTECGGIVSHPLEEVLNRNYSTAFRESLRQCAEELKTKEESLHTAYASVASLLSLPNTSSYQNLAKVRDICDVLSTAPVLPEQLLRFPSLSEAMEQVKACTFAGREAARLSQEILAEFEPQVFDYDYGKAFLLWKAASAEWFLPKAMKTSKLVKELRLYAKNPKLLTKSNIAKYYEMLGAYATQKAAAESIDGAIRTRFGMLWSDRPNFDAIDLAAANCLRLQRAACGQEGLMEKLVLAGANMEAFRAKALPTLTDYISCFDACETVLAALREEHKVDMDSLVRMSESNAASHGETMEEAGFANDWFALVAEKTTLWLQNLMQLKAWCVTLCILDEAVASGLGDVIHALKSGKLPVDEMISAFSCALGFACANETIDTTPVLQSFHGAQFDEKITRFAGLDEEFRMLTINEIIAKLSAKVPTASGNVANSSEIGILQKAIRSGGRGLSVRRLFDSIPTLLRMLCPCMLMSPISVAQYIDPTFPRFDLVIFDEASQLPTCEAVGAIARGENVIVVGDPKQLPPTSFFATNRVDEVNFEKEDLESVLDDCLALSMPEEHLLWHYRSRHESLIAFSNMQYYDNKLFTFPSPNDMVSEVVFVPVEGCYDRSRTKQNRAEGEKIVEEIVRRLKDSELRKESIGVVTFSVVQQHLIEDMLEEAFRKEPELEIICQGMYEPLFVKNLENVQGDERDVILFSICYGPDKDGKVTMNFGPLNRDGGWRRLNVAISRSRKRMMIFSTLRPEQIDLSKTMSDGVAGLRGFLEFASRGKNMLVARNGGSQAQTGGIAEQIAAAIRTLGYEAECNIGYSEYKVAIGVLDPEEPARFLLGILCDGADAGHTTARDRTILQPSVLSSLGWDIHRVWTLDWLDAPDRELQKIKNAVEAALKRKHDKEAAEIAKEIADLNGTAVVEEKMEEERPTTFSHEMFEKEAPGKSETHCVPYKSISAKGCFKAEEFYLVQNRELIARQINNIIMKEGPVCHKRLIRKELAMWGIARSGAKIEQMLSNLIREGKYATSESNGSIFYWSNGQKPEEYREYRIPTEEEDTKRTMDEIAAEEIANAICDVLHAQVSLTVEDLVRETAKVFGFTRLGSVIDTAVKEGLTLASTRGNVAVGDRVTLK